MHTQTSISAKRLARQRGMTLIEVLMGTMILAGGLIVLLTCLSTCIEMIAASKQVQQVQYVFDLAELKYPINEDQLKNVEELVPVSRDSSIVDGFTFERTVDEKDKFADVVDDKLYIVRSIVSWNYGKQSEEVMEYVRQTD